LLFIHNRHQYVTQNGNATITIGTLFDMIII